MFTLDANAARAADSKSGFIDEAGPYVGKFIRAEWITNSQTGSAGIGWTFKADAGAEAQLYTNITFQKDGKAETNEGGKKLLNAIMACLRVREVPNPTPALVEKWDADKGERVKASVPCFSVLMNKPIGLLFQMEIEKNSRKGNPRPTIYGVFEAATEKTATEVLAGEKCQKPELLAKMVAAVAAKPLIDRRPKGGSDHTYQAPGGPAPTGGFDDGFADDVPF